MGELQIGFIALAFLPSIIKLIVKSRVINILDPQAHVVFKTAAHFYHHNSKSEKAGIDNTYTCGNNHIPTQFYKLKQ